MSTMNIKVKTLKGGGEDAVECQVTPETTVGELRALIEGSKLAVPATAQRLIYQGRMLKEDGEPLSKFNVAEGACILLSDMSKLAGAAAATASAAPPATATPTVPTAGATPAAVAPAAVSSAPAGPLPAHTVILRAAIQGVRSSNPPEAAATALRTMQTIVGNVVGNPHEAKYRQIKRSNAAFARRVGDVAGTGAVLRAAGFNESPDTWDLAPSEQAWNIICSAKAELDAAVAALPPPAPAPGVGVGAGAGGAQASPFGGGMGGMPGVGGPPGGMGGGGMPGMGGVDPGMMAQAMQMMQSNPAMRQQALDQIRAMRPELAAQAEALMGNPAVMQNAMQMMQSNPQFVQQAMAMAQQQQQQQQAGGGTGGAPAPAMPGFPPAPQAAAPPGGQQQQQGQDDAGMTEEEMINEAIARSLREM